MGTSTLSLDFTWSNQCTHEKGLVTRGLVSLVPSCVLKGLGHLSRVYG